MQLISDKNFNKFYWMLCSVIFIIVAFRAFFLPFSHDEAATFYFYIQSDNYLPYSAHVYTNNHVLNSALSNVCYHIFGSHRFFLRLPNILSFVVMCYGIYKLFKYFKNNSSKLILITFFLLTFNFLDFFELCRGYGLSFGFMTLGLAYLLDYFEEKKTNNLILFSLLWQLALAANLILVLVFTILLFYVLVFQLQNKILFNLKNAILHFFNVLLLIFWIKFSFFYKEQGMLDYGVGSNYWQVTFKTLIQFLFGTDLLIVQFIFLIAFAFILIYSFFLLLKKPIYLINIYSRKLVFSVIFMTCILAFYLLKKLLAVNFPEDRTGLFFYLFFVVSLAFLFDNFSQKIVSKLTSLIFIIFIFIFSYKLNFKNFTSLYYHTMPKALFDKLTDEYKKTNQIFTIGGHRVRELNYAFLNYRGGAVLNHMDDSEQMTMNCDYYYAMKREKPYYKFYYDEIGEDKQWDRVLLKRKEKIKRNKLVSITNTPKKFNSNKEYFEFCRFGDSLTNSINCLEADVAIEFKKVPKPFNSFLVFSVENEKKEMIYFKRIPLNWLSDNLTNVTKYFKLTTGPLPKNNYTAIVFIWNIDKEVVEFNLNALTINQLFAKGINFTIPQNFYPLIETISKQPLL